MKRGFLRIRPCFTFIVIVLTSCLALTCHAESDTKTARPYCEIRLKDFPGLPIQAQKERGPFSGNYLHRQLSKNIPELKQEGEPAIVVQWPMPGLDPGIVYLSTPKEDLSDQIFSEAAKIIVDGLDAIFKERVKLLSGSLTAKGEAAHEVEGKLNEITSPLGVDDLEAESKRLRDSIVLLRQDVFKLELREAEIAAREEFLTRQLQPSLTADEIRRRIERKPKRLHVPPAEQEGTAKPIMLFITPSMWRGQGGTRPPVEVEARFVEVLATDNLINPGGRKWQWPVRAVLSEKELESLWQIIDQQDRYDLLSAPRVVTRSGQQACIEVVEQLSYPVEFDIEKGLHEAKATNWERRDVGIILKVKPTASKDGNMISLDFSAEVCNLVRWQNYGTEKCPIHQPVFETRRCAANVRLADRQTFLISSEIRPGQEKQLPAPAIPAEKETPDMTGEIIRLEAEMAGVRSSLKKVRLELEKCRRRREIVTELLPKYEELRQELDLRKEWVAEARKKLIEAKDALITSQPEVIEHRPGQ